MRQIALIYYRKRDKHGVPRPIEGEWFEEDDVRLAYKNFIGMGLAFGRELADLEKEWAEATKNGKPQ